MSSMSIRCGEIAAKGGSSERVDSGLESPTVILVGELPGGLSGGEDSTISFRHI